MTRIPFSSSKIAICSFLKLKEGCPSEAENKNGLAKFFKNKDVLRCNRSLLAKKIGCASIMVAKAAGVAGLEPPKNWVSFSCSMINLLANMAPACIPKPFPKEHVTMSSFGCNDCK